MPKNKLVRTAAIGASLNVLLKGQLSYLNQYFEVEALSSNDDYLQQLPQREGVKIKAINIERKIAPLKDLKSLLALYKYFKQQKPLIVHSITPKAGLLSMMAARMAGVPIRMHSFTGLIFPSKTGLMQKLLIAMDKLLCQCATHIYPEGRGVMHDLQQFNITQKPLKVIANGNINGVDLDYFNPEIYTQEDKNQLKTNLGFAPDDFILIFVGRITTDKGVNELLEAFDALSQTQPKLKLLMVGPMEQDLDPIKASSLQILQQNKQIKSVGFQADIRPYLSIAHTLVLPSYREGFPNVVLQAGAMALPCVVTNINGANEIITHQHNGLIVDIKNTTALSGAIQEIYQQKNQLLSMQTKARQNIINKYQQHIIWQAWLDEYHKNIACTKTS